MTDKSLPLLVQSSRDALEESLAELSRAVEMVEDMDRRGKTLPLKPAQLERARAQCVAALRILDAAAGSLRD